MSVRSFGGTIGFGLVAGIGFPGFAALCAPLIGSHAALRLYLALGAILYSALLGRDLRQRVSGAFGAALFVVPTALLTGEIASMAMAAALATAITRSWRSATNQLPRTIGIEAGLAVFGFAFVAALGGPGWVSISLAIWGWFLVQSLYFLVGGLSDAASHDAVDPFDLATQEVNRILERE